MQKKTKTRDVVETASTGGDFKVFTAALAEAGLKEPLQEKGPYTVFAPTDQAFASVPRTQLDAYLKPENRESLRLLLRNHILFGKLKTDDLKRLKKTHTAKGEEIRISGRDEVSINRARILAPNIEASNGIVHGIDKVLMPRELNPSSH